MTNDEGVRILPGRVLRNTVRKYLDCGLSCEKMIDYMFINLGTRHNINIYEQLDPVIEREILDMIYDECGGRIDPSLIDNRYSWNRYMDSRKFIDEI